MNVALQYFKLGQYQIERVPLTLPNPPAKANLSLRLTARRAGRTKTDPALCPPRHAPAALHFWHLASLDAPTVVVVWSLAFAWVVHARLPLRVLTLQVLVVWTVYVGDRLLDARAGLRRWGNQLRERHFFHWRYRHILAPLAAGAACVAAWIVFKWVPAGARERDSVLAAASLAYFTRVHTGALRVRRLFSKELLVGVLFTAGCALPVWSAAHVRALALPIVFFAALAWLNCRAIERWEGEHSGMARAAVWTAIAGTIAAAMLAWAAPRSAALLACGAASALLLAWLDRRRGRMTAVTLRAAADLVLLTPVLLLTTAWAAWR